MTSKKQLFLSSLLFSLCLSAWPVLMAIAQPQGTLIEEKFQWILQNQAVFKLQFFLAFLISPLLIYMMIGQLRHSKIAFGRSEAAGYLFLGVYAVLCSISYGAQFVLVPELIRQKMDVIAQVAYFDSGTSVSYFLNQTGYFFWAIGAIVLFHPFLYRNGPVKSIAVIYMVSAALSILAFIGLVLENKLLNMMTFISGISLLPVGILSMLWSNKSPSEQ